MSPPQRAQWLKAWLGYLKSDLTSIIDVVEITKTWGDELLKRINLN